MPARRAGVVRRGESVRCGSAAAKKLFERARAEGWEGVLLKRVDAPYAAGRRTPDWRKVKLEREQEFVIGGFTAPTQGAARDHLGALLVGYYDAQGRLRYAGKVGTGYTASMLALLARKLAPLRRAASPFVDAPRSERRRDDVGEAGARRAGALQRDHGSGDPAPAELPRPARRQGGARRSARVDGERSRRRRQRASLCVLTAATGAPFRRRRGRRACRGRRTSTTCCDS